MVFEILFVYQEQNVSLKSSVIKQFKSKSRPNSILETVFKHPWRPFKNKAAPRLAGRTENSVSTLAGVLCSFNPFLIKFELHQYYNLCSNPALEHAYSYQLDMGFQGWSNILY